MDLKKEKKMMNELTMDERQNDIWLRKDKNVKYAVILMYRSTDSEVKWITKGPLEGETAVKMIEDMLNMLEDDRYVCLNSQFVNPHDVITVKLDLWKDKEDRREFGGKTFYE